MTDTNQFSEVLKKLRSEIAALSNADENSRKKLESLVEDLEKRQIMPDHDKSHEGLADRLKDSILYFEVSHPALTATLNDIMVKLSNMGI